MQVYRAASRAQKTRRMTQRQGVNKIKQPTAQFETDNKYNFVIKTKYAAGDYKWCFVLIAQPNSFFRVCFIFFFFCSSNEIEK